MSENIYTLKFHETIIVTDIKARVTRVAGGWVYYFFLLEKMIFVPYDGEFKSEI